MPRLTPPFTADEYLRAAGNNVLPENEVREYRKPRASSLGACARQQAYAMAGTKKDELGAEYSGRTIDNELTAEQGRHFEDLSVQIIESMGLRVVDRQIELPPEYPVTGHPDGRLEDPRSDDVIGPGLYVPTTDRLSDGLVWGFEHKHLGRYSYEDVLKKGFEAAHPNYILQTALYGDALGWDASLFLIVAQDSSAVRGDATSNLRAKNPAVRWSVHPDMNPKVLVIPVDLRPLKHGLVPVAHERAKWLTEWREAGKDPSGVAREADPTFVEQKWVPDGKGDRMQVDRVKFPCGWCPYLSKCLEAGGGGEPAPKLPWTTEVVESDSGD